MAHQKAKKVEPTDPNIDPHIAVTDAIKSPIPKNSDVIFLAYDQYCEEAEKPLSFSSWFKMYWRNQ